MILITDLGECIDKRVSFPDRIEDWLAKIDLRAHIYIVRAK